MKKEIILTLAILLFSFTFISSELIQDSLHISLITTDSNNNTIKGIYDFNFSISNDSLCNYTIKNYSFENINTNPEGRASFYLDNTSMSYNTQYYLKELRDNVLIGCFKISYPKNHMISNVSELINDLNFINSTTLNEGNLNVNSSLSLNTSIGYIKDVSSTQMQNNGGVLNLIMSFFYNLFYQKSEVYNKTEIDNNLSNYYLASNPNNYINTTGDSWASNYTAYYNKSQIDANFSLYYLNSNPSNFWNSTWAGFNKTYADTLYASISVTGDNSSWNESKANTLYANISWNYNQTTPAIIWANNTIQSNNASWLSTYNSTYDANLVNHTNITFNTYNSTWDNSFMNIWNYNQTTATYNLYNAVWLSTYNVTYATLLNQNCPNGQVINGTLANGTFICTTPTFTETDPVWQSNYTIFTGLINNASYLSTFNITYAGYATNVSINHTLNTYTNWNTAWSRTDNATYSTLLNQSCPSGQVVNGTLANGTFICTTPTFTETDPVWQSNYTIFTGLINNASYLSTFNITYANYVTANYTNKSEFWDNMGTINATQMENSGGYLNILVSWLTSLFYTESEIDSKIINNQSYFSTSNTTYSNLLNQNCPTGKIVNGTLANGTFICTTDQTTAGGGNPFDQSLNKSDSVQFSWMNLTNIGLSNWLLNIVNSSGQVVGELSASEDGDVWFIDDGNFMGLPPSISLGMIQQYSNIYPSEDNNGDSPDASLWYDWNVTKSLYVTKNLTVSSNICLGGTCRTTWASGTDSWAGNYTYYYNKTQIDTNLSLRYLATNPNNYINFTNLSNFNSNNFNGSGWFNTTGGIKTSGFTINTNINGSGNITFGSNKNITTNATCIKISGATSILEIC